MAAKLSDPATSGERLWLWRKRAGLTQIQAARMIRVGRNHYREMELDREPAPFRPLDTTTELVLALARRRLGKGLRETARLVGVSHRTLLLWEKEADPRLVGFWKAKGLRFTFR